MIANEIVQKHSQLNSKKNRIVILSDSLAMPRFDGSLNYEETYPYILKQELGNDIEIINRSKRANTILTQTTDNSIYDDILMFNPKYVVIQLGIVDCAPRLFSLSVSKNVIGRIRPLNVQKFVIKQFSKRRLFFTKHFPKQYVTLPKFFKRYDYLLKIVKEFGSIPVIVNISSTSSENERRSFGFEGYINSYNSVIEMLAQKYNAIVIDMFKISKNNPILLEDGIHLNNLGSKIIAQEIITAIKHIDSL